MAFESFRSRRGLAFFSRSQSRRRPRSSNRLRPGGPRLLEALEARLALTTFYVDGQLQLTADRDASGALSAGDQVTFGNGQSYQQTQLTYDAAAVSGDVGTAFSSITQALASSLVQSGDTIDVAGGTYNESIVIDKSLTIQGFGSVSLQAPVAGQGTGITIDNNPASVTLANLAIANFNTSLSANGVGTLTLSDVSFEPPIIAIPLLSLNLSLADPTNKISNVTTLNLISTGSAPQHVLLDPGPPMGMLPYVQMNDLAIALQDVTNLSITTGGGSDTFNVWPVAKNITLDGGDPVPPAQPGDTLNVSLPSYSGNSLSASKDNTGYTGVWAFSSGDQIHFSHFETLLPGVIVQGYQSFQATEGIDTGNVTLAKFTDPLGNLPLSDYSAQIDWQDGTTSTAAIAFDSSTGVYTVSGHHVFGEPNGDDLKITIHRTGSPDTAIYAAAVVADLPLVGSGSTLSGTAGETLGAAAGGAVVATFKSSGDEHDAPSAFWTHIDWGDGAWSPGTVAAADSSGEQFSLSGSHIYSKPGSYAIIVTVADGAQLTTINSTAVIAAPTPPPVLSGNQLLVSKLYGDLLHRLADAGGLTYWSGRLAAGLSRSEMAADIENTAEYRRDEIDSLFVRYLHRHADPGALDSLSAQLAAGTSDEAIAATIAGSDEYFKLQGGTNDGFLAGLFNDGLGRPIDPGAKTALQQDLAQGASRRQIALTVLDSHENHLLVAQNAYTELLDRAADIAGYVHWADFLDLGLSDEQLLASFAETQEYFNG